MTEVQGETKFTYATALKKGSYVLIDGEPCKVVDTSTSRPGKHGHAKVRITGVGILDGKKRQMVAPGHDNITVPVIEKRSAQVLSIAGKMANVMDAESYETFDLEIPDDIKAEVVEGCNILYWVITGTKVMKQVKPE
ncbi:translation initiation factor IF-5A [Candidatus Woesearchaeota archaeon CG10_big_fil_rev_8_21_14_0_10_34_8]|nr:MAG: translation initiation factor IF-5A [Candidatus Woesearchaeota archaeon CG10_big_fil_rev_8_21_14_0_10_34_8]